MGHGVFPLASTGKYRLDHPVSLPKLDLPRLLRQYGLHTDKSLGQNFLIDEAYLERIVELAHITPGEVVLEIGPGLGNLTRHLARNARAVVAVELDRALIPPLKQVISPYPNVKVIAGDILALDPVKLVSQQDYIVVANIPYYITSVLIRHLLEASIPPQRLVLTLQREVATRICAAPGDMSLLSLSVQVYGRPEILTYIPASAFYPPPKIDSAVIRVDIYHAPLIPPSELEVFFRLVKAGFNQKRKTMRNALSAGLHQPSPVIEAILRQAQIDPMRRAETLSIPEWHRLSTLYANNYPY